VQNRIKDILSTNPFHDSLSLPPPPTSASSPQSPTTMLSKLTHHVFDTLHHSMTDTSRLDLTSLIHFNPHDTNLSISGPAPRTKWLRTYLVNRFLATNETSDAALADNVAEKFMRLGDEELLNV
jgi:hypothetical protein